MVTYIQGENDQLNLTSEEYLEICKHPRWSFLREQFTAEAIT